MLDETYLETLCTHLAGGGPPPGQWTRHAQRWTYHRGRNGTILTPDPLSFANAVGDAGLPLPPDRPSADQAFDEQNLAHTNALTAVLAVHAVLAKRNTAAPHHADAPDIGYVLGSLDSIADPSLDILVQQLQQGSVEAWGRLLRMLDAHATRRTQTDLRTVAALAYTPSGRPPQALRSNPTGHWQAAFQHDRVFRPVAQVAMSLARARHTAHESL
ncbi:hypothetical protein [Streptomyces nanshensis]|uniref:Uncharacterized protein n=1 Tax=Streptomyces nanshensis TaxID=518642 RepID=A0A1E7L587_9ACTN|nr:hypothetical protein [Streptomyces nanshensis]OEV11344.1 hypothetical protein AN218_13425 [Streptomyces nanshensis]